MNPDSGTSVQTTCTVIVGHNGTGKTTLVRRMVTAEMRKPNGRVLVVTPDDSEWNDIPMVHPRFPRRIASYRGARRIIFEEGMMDHITRYMQNGLLVLDDCRSYLDAAVGSEVHKMLIRRRQRKLDMVFVAHGFDDIPPRLYVFASHYIIFMTADKVAKRRSFIRNYELVEKVVAHVNEQYHQNKHYHQILKV